jgi:hypothetical protein
VATVGPSEVSRASEDKEGPASSSTDSEGAGGTNARGADGALEADAPLVPVAVELATEEPRDSARLAGRRAAAT